MREPAKTNAPPMKAVAPRVFVGIKVAPEIADELACIAQALVPFGVRPVPAADIHLTLVPPWNEVAPAHAVDRMRVASSDVRPFALVFMQVGYGPDPRRPRYLWADCAASVELKRLRLALLGVFGQGEPRPFRPHVTLARLRDKARMIARKCRIDRGLSLTQQVRSVELFQSPPAGETGYRILASLPLTAAPA